MPTRNVQHTGLTMSMQREVDWKKDPLVKIEKVFHAMPALAMGPRDEAAKAAFDTGVKACLSELEGGAIAPIEVYGARVSAAQKKRLSDLGRTFTVQAANCWEAGGEDLERRWSMANALRETLEEATDILRDVFLTHLIAMQNRYFSAVDQAVGDINTISRQINFISINASIEAARVGDMGRGFGLIAHEIRDLAGKTSQVVNQMASDARSGA